MTPGAELGDVLPPASLQVPGETPAGLELWASPRQPHPGNTAAAAEGREEGARSPAPARVGRFLEPVPSIPSGLFWLQTGELRRVKVGGAPLTSRECVLCLPVYIQRLGRGEVGGVAQRTHLATRASAR